MVSTLVGFTTCFPGIPSIPDLIGPISQAGSGWLEHIAHQAGQVAEQMGGSGGGGWFEQLTGKLEESWRPRSGACPPTSRTSSSRR